MVELGYDSIVTGLQVGQSGNCGSASSMALRFFNSPKMSRPTLGPVQAPIQAPGVLSTTVKQPGHKAGHSLPSNATNEWSCSSTPLYVFMVYTGTTLP